MYKLTLFLSLIFIFTGITNCYAQENPYPKNFFLNDDNTIKELLKGGLNVNDEILWDASTQQFVSRWPVQLIYEAGKNKTADVEFSEVYLSENQLINSSSPQEYLLKEIAFSLNHQDNSRDRGLLILRFDTLGRLIYYERFRTDGDTMFKENINRDIVYHSHDDNLNQIIVDTDFKTELFYSPEVVNNRRVLPQIKRGNSQVTVRMNENSLIDEVKIVNSLESDDEIEKNEWSTYYFWDDFGRPTISRSSEKQLTHYSYTDTSFNLSQVAEKYPLVNIPCVMSWLENFDSNRLTLTSCNSLDFILLDKHKLLMQLNPPNSKILGKLYYEISDSLGFSTVVAEIDSSVNFSADCVDLVTNENEPEPEFAGDFHFDYNSKHYLRGGTATQTDYNHYRLKNGWHFYVYKEGAADFRSRWFSIGKRVTSQFRTKTYVITNENGLVQYVSLNNILYRFQWK
ncbi:hypothetical protein [Brumimicrobium mesophilum]|uniref:hypothetical protein n=1 Tax=Brumimicrobium mesophilum TaxID=392717 RepID=UPI00131D5A4D|nr:hypothetical protein [Brumimicrobium mesophilum]